MKKTKGIEWYINLLKQEISRAGSNEVKIVNNELVYSLKNIKKIDISSYRQNTLGELGRAYAVLKMLNEFKISPQAFVLEETSIVGSPSKRLDLKIFLSDTYNGRNCIALVECKTSIHRISDQEFINYFKKQLYNIAHSYAKSLDQPYPLVLITCEVTFNDQNEIDFFYRWFLYPEIEKTTETGQISLDKIIFRNSSFAYDTQPVTDSSGKVYFHKRPLKKDDLIEITNSNELKTLLKEKLHQGLRKYGITEEQAFETVLNLLLAKTFDEIQLLHGRKSEPDFQVRAEDYKNKDGFYNRIQNLFREGLINLLGEDPKEVYNTKYLLEHSDKEEILLNIVPYLQRIRLRSLRFLEEDSIGDIYLDFMHSIFKQTRGLFFTHPNICKFVCRALNIEEVRKNLEEKTFKYILDPSCGSGTFLIESLRLIFKNFPVEDIRENALKILFGVDNSSKATALCKVNMVIHGDGSANIYTRDALSPLSSLPFPFINEQKIIRDQVCTPESLKEGCGVDFILTNPPFSLEIRYDEYNHFRMKEFLNFKRGVSTASECLFVERWYQLLNPEGRLGAVLPLSLFDSNEYLKARLLFICYFKIVALVGLPEHAFAPHAQQKTVLVFAKRRSLEKSNQLFDKINRIDEFINEVKDEKIIFYEAKNIGYIRKKKRKTVNTINIEKNDLTNEIAEIIAKAFNGIYEENEKITIKTLGDFYENGQFNLNPFSINVYTDLTLPAFNLKEKGWKIVTVEKVEIFDCDRLLICETGDIVPGGAGIITPKKLENTTSANIERIKRKIKSGSFGKLRTGDIIIAPVRIYQKKIAVVTESATEFLFSKDFIVLRREEPDLNESFSLFLSLIHNINIKRLESLSSTGKSGYPKIKNKKDILQLKFYEIKIPEEKLKTLVEIYDKIYQNIFKDLIIE